MRKNKYLKPEDKNVYLLGDNYYANINDTAYKSGCDYRRPEIINPNLLCNQIYRTNVFEFWKYITDKEVPGIINNRYIISNFGRTWDCKQNHPIPFSMRYNTKFYVQIYLRGIDGKIITRKLHRVEMLVFEYFPGCEKYEVNHIDGYHNNNLLLNLEWVTSDQNKMHSIMIGRAKTSNGTTIKPLTEEQVHQIYTLREVKKYTYNKIAEIMGFPESVEIIKRIVEGRSANYSKWYN